MHEVAQQVPCAKESDGVTEGALPLVDVGRQINGTRSSEIRSKLQEEAGRGHRELEVAHLALENISLRLLFDPVPFVALFKATVGINIAHGRTKRETGTVQHWVDNGSMASTPASMPKSRTREEQQGPRQNHQQMRSDGGPRRAPPLRARSPPAS